MKTSEAQRRGEGAVEWRGKHCADLDHKHSRCPFRVRVANGQDPQTGRRRQLYATGQGNARAAETALRDLLNQRDEGVDTQPKKLTVGDWMMTWLDGRIADGKVGPRAAENYRTILTKRVTPAIGATRLRDLRTDHIVTFKTSLVDAKLAPATIAKVLGLVKQSLEAALVSRLIVRNPAAAVPRPSVPAAAAQERRALSQEDLKKLVKEATDTSFEVPIHLALATGMRQSELLGLRWEDVDLERKTLVVRQTIQQVAGEFQALPPKTRNSRRVIELSAATVATLKRHKAAQNAERLRQGEVWADNDLVLPGRTGEPQYRRIFYRDYVLIVRAAKVDRPGEVNWHTLRHTAASLWIKAGVDIFTVSRRLGHAKTSFTMDVYAHLLEGQQKQAAEALDHLLARSTTA